MNILRRSALNLAFSIVSLFFSTAFVSAATEDGALGVLSNSPEEGARWNPEGAFRLSRFYLTDGPYQNLKRAFDWDLCAAERGYPEAEVNLAAAYLSGTGVATNRVKALEWLRKLGKQGYSKPQLNAAKMLLSGEGVGTNYAEAAEWFRMAAIQGEPQAQQNLGALLALGEGVPKDLVEAYKWLSLAVKAGIKESRDAKSWVEARISPDQLAVAKQRLASFSTSNATPGEARAIAVLPIELRFGEPGDDLQLEASDFFTAERIHAVNGLSFISSAGVNYVLRLLKLSPRALDLSADLGKRLSVLVHAATIVSGKATRRGREWKCNIQFVEFSPAYSFGRREFTATNLFDLREKMFASILELSGGKIDQRQASLHGCETCRSDSEIEPLLRGYADFRKSDSFASLEKAARLALKQNPKCVEALISLATGVGAQGKGAESDAILTNLVASYPDAAKAYQVLGVLSIIAHDLLRAESLLVRSQLLDPKDVKTLMTLAQLYQIEGDLGSALFYLEEATDVDPFLAETHAMLAAMSASKGDLKTARDSVTEAERLTRGTLTEEEKIGVAYQAMGNTQRALRHFQTCIALA